MKQKTKCPECKENEIRKDGKRKTQNRGSIQRYRCKNCFHRFVEDNGFYRMRNNSQKITLCLDLFYRGVSTRKVQEHLRAFYPKNSSHKSIYKWIIKYSKIISGFTDNIKVSLGGELQVDEMEYNRRKSHKKKGIERNWFIDSVDTKTRFMVSSDFVKSRDFKEINKVVSHAKQKSENQILTYTTDGFNVYDRVVKRNAGYVNLKKGLVTHNKVTASKGEGFNIMIERLHNNIRHRTKTFRGLHGSIDSAKAIMKGYEIYYNFITKHQAIGKCPYELATDLELNSENKWLELIQISKKQ